MTPPGKLSIMTAALISSIAVLTGCSTSTYEERMAYLRKVANRGVDTYKLLYSQEAHIDKARCARAFEGSGADNDMPRDDAASGVSLEWRAQAEEFFVDSCVSGKPKPVPGDLPYPSASPPTTLSVTPSASSSK